MIKTEIKSTLHKLIDHVQIKTDNIQEDVILNLDKDNLKGINEIKKKDLKT